MFIKKRIAFIKFGGMAFGGTEKVLQTIAAELPKNIYEVDFFYCDAAPLLGQIWNTLIPTLQELNIVKITE